MTRRAVRALLAAGVGAALVAGCAAQEVALTERASLALSASVLDVATAASAGDPTTALATLDAVQERLDGAVAGDEVTADRAARIQLSIDTVRADLQALVAAAVEEAVPAPVEPLPPAEVTQQPVEEAPADDSGDDGKGKGKDKGKDNPGKEGKGPGANNGKGKGAKN